MYKNARVGVPLFTNSSSIAPKSRKTAKSEVVMHSRLIGSTNKTRLEVIRGDITKVKATAVVIPCGNRPSLNGMVGKAFSITGGSEFRSLVGDDYHIDLESCEVSATTVSISTLPNLSHAIYLNSPTWSLSDPGQAQVRLTRAVNNCLNCCDKRQFTSIALPSIGSGNNKFPKELAARTILGAVKLYCDGKPDTCLESIKFVLFDQQSLAVYQTELKNLV